MRTVAIAQARMGSTRAPGKVMRNLGGKPVLRWTVDALRAAEGIDEVVVATSTLDADDVIAVYCRENSIPVWRGSETDVLDRYVGAANAYSANVVLRLTCDCPFLDPKVIGEVIKLRDKSAADYASNVNPPTYPDGLDVECFTIGALLEANAYAKRQSDRECVTQYIVRNQSRFMVINATCPVPGLAKERWVLDTEEDFLFCQEVVKELGQGPYNYLQILNLLDRKPNIRALNQSGIRNERFYEDVATEKLPEPSFVRSQKQYTKAAGIIPFAAQTFSKSHLQYPVPFAPLFVSHGDGAKIFDIDGNGYVDMVSGLLPVVLGYRDPDVDEAIRRQLDKGITFSLSTELEAELARLLVKHIPCAEMVKFGKSGSDVTTAAVRLARHHTDRDTVVTLGGYHGWHDWAVVGSGRSKGVAKNQDVFPTSPKLLLSPAMPQEILKNVACIIIEPNDARWLREIRELCDQHGIVLIFDEVITGFRYAMGGAQECFGVTPDLACFGKAMANGMPISALVGKREIMEKMQPPDNIFYSGTMFGETLSIAAAIATIHKLERESVISDLWRMGNFIKGAINNVIIEHRLQDYVKIGGEAPRTILTFANDDLKTLFMIEMLRNGVLIINSNNVNWSHRNELKRITTAYENTLKTLAKAIHHGNVKERLNGAMVSPSPLRAAS